jgi:hypothetical protein
MMRLCTQCRLGAHDHCVCTDCEVCAHRFDHEARDKALSDAEKTIEALIMKPIHLSISLGPTRAKETLDDIHDGMQRALAVVRGMRKSA